MKSIKMFGLAALAALMAMAFAGASSAMAESTVLCKADESPCAAGNKITHIHELTASVSVFDSPFGFLLCNELFLGDVTGTGPSLTMSGTTTYTNCVRHTTGNPEPCLFAEVNGPSSRTVTKTGHETAAVTIKREVKVKCGVFINCVYNGEGLEGTAKGPLLSSETNGEVLFDKQVMHKVSGICPSEIKLSTTTTSLEAIYISS